MENFLEKEPVKKVNNFIKQFDSSLEITVLDKTARTAKDAEIGRASCRERV